MMEVSVGYINYEPIPRFPGVTRDIALEVNHEVTHLNCYPLFMRMVKIF